MGWLKDTFQKVTDPLDVLGDNTWGDLFDPGGFFDDPLEELEEITPEPPARLVDMSRAKAGQDIRERMRLGIGGSRGKSRVVSPFGSGPADRSQTGSPLTGSPVEGMSVATSPGSDIDSVSASAGPEWLSNGMLNTYQVRRPGDEPLTETKRMRSPFSLF